jgi:hypothetical protein
MLLGVPLRENWVIVSYGGSSDWVYVGWNASGRVVYSMSGAVRARFSWWLATGVGR